MYTFLLGIDLLMFFSYAFEFNIRTNNWLTYGITEPDCNLICIDWKIGLNGTWCSSMGRKCKLLHLEEKSKVYIHREKWHRGTKLQKDLYSLIRNWAWTSRTKQLLVLMSFWATLEEALCQNRWSSYSSLFYPDVQYSVEQFEYSMWIRYHIFMICSDKLELSCRKEWYKDLKINPMKAEGTWVIRHGEKLTHERREIGVQVYSIKEYHKKNSQELFAIAIETRTRNNGQNCVIYKYIRKDFFMVRCM